ncbi:3-hydroxybutyryl-CoA dehydrogenase [Nymphon striatum]|nr:3-hydroxybutyryl-CoA dehydrogenase [Nymphon striatum]
MTQAQESDATAIVLICEGRTFIAGADITEFGAGMGSGASLSDAQQAMENNTKPVVAAIHGTALGGGLEVGAVPAPSSTTSLPSARRSRSPMFPETPPVLDINKVGILGAGTMGGGIAMNFVNAGTPVVIVERDQDALDRGLAVVRKNYERSASRGRFDTAEVERRMGHVPRLNRQERLRRLRHGYRGRVREHGSEEDHLRRAGRHL